MKLVDILTSLGYAIGMTETMKDIKGESYTVSSEAATMPNGKAGFKVRCTCSTHPTGKGEAFMVTDDLSLVHGNVLLAHHPVLGKVQARTGNLFAT